MTVFSAMESKFILPIFAMHVRLLPAIVRNLCLIFCLALPMLPAESFAAPPTSDNKVSQGQSIVELSPEEQARLAERFAPLLVFHPMEQYFPCNPLFPFELEGIEPGRSITDGRSAVSFLGNPESRTERYLTFTIDEKARLAVVYYRAYPVKRRSEELIVLEYWLYYVQDTYKVRNNILPLWVDGSHPNDLEHIHIVLKIPPDSTPTENRLKTDTKFIVEEVYASAHDGTLPANRYRYSEQDRPVQTRFLVELGSHAIAPDIDGDGLFTPGRDGDSGYKMLWGIRDKGITWSRYSQSYMTQRPEQESTILSYGGSELLIGQEAAAGLPNYHFSYRLIPVRKLAEDFAALELTAEQRKDIFENPLNCFRQAMGKSNGNSEKLLLPPDSEAGGSSLDSKDYSSTERGFMFGAITLVAQPGAFLGGRYAFMNDRRYLPDLLFEVDGILAGDGTAYLSTQFLLTYPIDPSIKIMSGAGFITDSIHFNRRQLDWIAGGELRLGDFRIFAAARSSGAITHSSIDFRWAYFF